MVSNPVDFPYSRRVTNPPYLNPEMDAQPLQQAHANMDLNRRNSSGRIAYNSVSGSNFPSLPAPAAMQIARSSNISTFHLSEGGMSTSTSYQAQYGTYFQSRSAGDEHPTVGTTHSISAKRVHSVPQISTRLSEGTYPPIPSSARIGSPVQGDFYFPSHQ
jgi:hypothetical protein